MKRLIIMFLLLMLAACGSSRPVPDWISAGSGHLDDFKKSYLEGNIAVSDLYFSRAVAEIKKSGDLDVLAKAYLIRMAMDVAVLAKARDEDFVKIDAVESNSSNRNFHDFLKGDLKRVQVTLLPDQYHGMASTLLMGNTDKLAPELRKIEDPISRIIACGVCVRVGRFDEELLTAAVSTASYNGWKRALLAYLEKLRIFYTERSQQDKAAAIMERVQLISP